MAFSWVSALEGWWNRLSKEERLLWSGILLVVILLLGAFLLALLDRWRRRTPRDESVSASDQLAQFRSLYEQGQLSREEFERIRALLAPQIRQEMAVPAPAPAAAPAAPAAAAPVSPPGDKPPTPPEQPEPGTPPA